MATMNISLPDQMKDWVERQSEGGQYSNSSDYVRDLIRKDWEKREKIAVLQTKIDEGLASGISTRSADEIFEAAKARALAVQESDG